MKKIIIILFLLSSMPILYCQEKKKDLKKQETEEKKAILEIEKLKKREAILQENDAEYEAREKASNIMKSIRYQKINTKPNKSLGKKGSAIIQNIDDYEELEYEKISPYPNNEIDLGKTIHVHCPPYALNVGYSRMFLIDSEKFEENLEIQTDWMFFLSLSLRATLDSEFDSHFTFFAGFNAIYFQVEYGFSSDDYQAIRFRRSFNFYLAQKTTLKGDNKLFEDYTYRTYTHYHYQSFISSIFIEPIIEYRIGNNGQKSQFAIGLAFGVTF